MTNEELFAVCPVVRELHFEAAKPPKPNYCAYQAWHGLPGARGDVGFNFLIECNVPLEHQLAAKNLVRSAMSGCQHTASDAYVHLDDNTECKNWEDGCERSHMCEPKLACEPNFPVPPAEHPELSTADIGKQKVGTTVSLVRDTGKAGVSGLLERLRHAGRGPAAVLFDPRAIDDAAQPVFVVRSDEEAQRLKDMLRFSERLEAKEIGPWYAREAIYTCDAEARKALLSTTKLTVTGPISWRPVVLTFVDADVERKLSEVCVQVVTATGTRKFGDDFNTFTLAEVLDAVKDIKPVAESKSADMPLAVLDGWLGEVCRTRMLKDFPVAYAWPALLAAASALVGRQLLPEPAGGFQTRANMYVGIIGPVESGKTSVFNLAFWLLGLVNSPELYQLKSGSPEGMASAIGDIGGAQRLVFVNELEHLMKKVNIEGSTFANFLNDVWYDDKQELVIARGKRITFNCRLSLAGGVPQQGFEEVFGVGSTTGLHSRFCLSVCPSDFEGYIAHPPDGAPALVKCEEAAFNDDRPQAIAVAPDVYEETKRWRKELKLSGRSVELAMRAAVTCAAFDCRGTLTASQLGPALAFAKYQEDVHRRFEPNPGKNSEAIVCENVMRYLREKFSNGEWAERRPMLNNIHAWHHGASVVNRALSALKQSNMVELGNAGRKMLVRLVLEK